MRPDAIGGDEDFTFAFRKGDAEAFDHLFRTFHGRLTFYAMKFVQDEMAAEDIVQDCFAELWQRRQKHAKVQAVQAYLYRCVYNHCAKWLEKTKKTLPEFPADPEIIESEALARIQQVMEHLPPRMKQVVKLHYLENYSLDEIAQTIGIDPETVRSHRYRAIQFLRKTIITG